MKISIGFIKLDNIKKDIKAFAKSRAGTTSGAAF